MLNVATGVEATSDSLFQIGSITKLWTATQIMLLASRGGSPSTRRCGRSCRSSGSRTRRCPRRSRSGGAHLGHRRRPVPHNDALNGDSRPAGPAMCNRWLRKCRPPG
ncbi:beta-lactamase family protein [Microbispora bryophytorum]|uniref:beta-lactamase family protein n=1 Tax=Microbispora bryophytorum TaxID=1460882 RepID=UPI001E2F8619|nr:beta-lactamase family protein [Microbispora bryophytorum]